MVHKEHNNALTLVEILIVLGIIAVLTTIVVALTLRVENQSKAKAQANVFALLDSALQEYHEYYDAFPVQAERDFDHADEHMELLYEALSSVPASRAVLKEVSIALVEGSAASGEKWKVHDVWGTVLDYVYVPGDHFPELISAGPDKEFDTADDISSRNQ